MPEKHLIILLLVVPLLCQLSKPSFTFSISWTNKKINVFSAVSSDLPQLWVILHRWDSYCTINGVDTLEAYSKRVHQRLCGWECSKTACKCCSFKYTLGFFFFSPQVFKCKIAIRGLLQGIISSHLISTRNINHNQKVAKCIRARSTCSLTELGGCTCAHVGSRVYAHPFLPFSFFYWPSHNYHTISEVNDFLLPVCQDQLFSFFFSFFCLSCRNKMKEVCPTPNHCCACTKKMTNGPPRCRLNLSTPALKSYCVCAWIEFKMTYSIDLCACACVNWGLSNDLLVKYPLILLLAGLLMKSLGKSMSAESSKTCFSYFSVLLLLWPSALSPPTHFLHHPHTHTCSASN